MGGKRYGAAVKRKDKTPRGMEQAEKRADTAIKRQKFCLCGGLCERYVYDRREVITLQRSII